VYTPAGGRQRIRPKMRGLAPACAALVHARVADLRRNRHRFSSTKLASHMLVCAAMKGFTLAFLIFAACGPGSRDGGTGADAHGGGDGNSSGGDGNSGGSYLVYAHSDTVLYTVDLTAKTLVTVGNFDAPVVTIGSTMKPDPITDLAVAPNGTIYVVSETALYTASAQDGHVTKLGSLAACGQRGVALTTTSDGRLWIGDFMGAICQIDISVNPPAVRAPVMMQNGLALSGDMVGVGNGTVFGTAYKLSDSAGQGTQNNNLLVSVDVATGAVTQIGSSGYPKLFGIAFQDNKVFGFTHDGTGRVVTIDTTNGHGTMFNTFMDQAAMGISFAGAGVSSLVVIQ
jgi:hypothetical protein